MAGLIPSSTFSWPSCHWRNKTVKAKREKLASVKVEMNHVMARDQAVVRILIERFLGKN